MSPGKPESPGVMLWCFPGPESPGKRASGPAKIWKSVKIDQKKARTLQTGSIKNLVKTELG